MTPLLALQGLSKAYAGRTVLNVKALALDAGHSYALTGHGTDERRRATA